MYACHTRQGKQQGAVVAAGTTDDEEAARQGRRRRDLCTHRARRPLHTHCMPLHNPLPTLHTCCIPILLHTCCIPILLHTCCMPIPLHTIACGCTPLCAACLFMLLDTVTTKKPIRHKVLSSAWTTAIETIPTHRANPSLRCTVPSLLLLLLLPLPLLLPGAVAWCSMHVRVCASMCA